MPHIDYQVNVLSCISLHSFISILNHQRQGHLTSESWRGLVPGKVSLPLSFSQAPGCLLLPILPMSAGNSTNIISTVFRITGVGWGGEIGGERGERKKVWSNLRFPEGGYTPLSSSSHPIIEMSFPASEEEREGLSHIHKLLKTTRHVFGQNCLWMDQCSL